MFKSQQSDDELTLSEMICSTLSALLLRLIVQRFLCIHKANKSFCKCQSISKVLHLNILLPSECQNEEIKL